MVKERARFVSRPLCIADILLTVLSFISAFWIRDLLFSEAIWPIISPLRIPSISPYCHIDVGLPSLFPENISISSDRIILKRAVDLLRVVLFSGLLLILFVLRYHFVSRLFIATFLVINFIVFCLEEG